jgi:hypothetical protein
LYGIVEIDFDIGRAQLLKEHLRVEVLNARHLKPPEIHRGNCTDILIQISLDR